MLPESTEVLIVGAGPAGLTSAISLLKRGIKNITIVDAQERGQNTSRAIVIHARTVEELHDIGCSGPFIERGNHAKYMRVSKGQRRLVKANFGTLKNITEFPYALLISQSETEEILLDMLQTFGVQVVRPLRVSDMQALPDGIKVVFESGEVVKAQYVVGADGSRSTVRQLAKIPFKDLNGQDPHAELKGKDLTSDSTKFGLPLIIADVHLSEDARQSVPADSISTFLGPLGFLLLVPLPPAKGDADAKPIYRMSCPPEKGAATVTLEYLQKVADAALGLPKDRTPKVEEVLWSSRFRVRSAVADSFYKRFGGGIVLLAGDAAHVHSPAGGQGMNLGIRDAIQLGRVLSSIIELERAKASPETIKAFSEKTLTEFSDERRKLATKVIKMTKLMTWATGLKAATARSTRNAVWRLLGSTPIAPNRLALQLSGLQPA
ncbi:hypothetical protein GALMADRAFT_104035 [Galerina marginata CBS 339.88]|uniref:FAD-binding domain-containing protein n=1 Tax=Galerina marginata (strain CBS 339.88) TaxID=685588 RepID=A0A067SFA5_GALM3|nr:hypothetical protein GALMADRAFT_104035 [Galerina marginata CBS 339.88]